MKSPYFDSQRMFDGRPYLSCMPYRFNEPPLSVELEFRTLSTDYADFCRLAGVNREGSPNELPFPEARV